MKNRNTAGRAGGRERLDSVFACLADSDCRRLLGILHEQAPDPLTRRDLASALVHGTTPLKQRTQEVVEQSSITLHHEYLPRLDAAGLIEYDTTQGIVQITDHLAYQDAGIVEIIGADETAESESLDALFGALADGRRRTILDILSHQFQPIHIETLAREIGAKELGVTEQDVPPAVVDQILVGMHHVSLPHLADADLIEHDDAEGMVVYNGHPELRVAWMHSVLQPEFRASLTGETEPGELGTLEGRETVISYGQSLGDRAEKELFCMFTHRDMLEMGCFTRVKQAAERGVNVYLGTFDETVREYVREEAPDVVLWEPKTDWLNLPVEGNKVGRLLMADREAVMLGTLKSETDDGGIPEEKAIIGEGADNTLVIMIRQMMSSHLNQIDEQTAEVRTRLPF